MSREGSEIRISRFQRQILRRRAVFLSLFDPDLNSRILTFSNSLQCSRADWRKWKTVRATVLSQSSAVPTLGRPHVGDGIRALAPKFICS